MMNSKRTFYQPITMTKKMIKNTSYEGERPLFASHHLRLEDVTIYPGESALKECSDIEAVRCEFRGKYPFWHNDGLLIENCLFREGARAAIWYSRNLRMKDTRVEAPKMFRDMDGMVLEERGPDGRPGMLLALPERGAAQRAGGARGLPVHARGEYGH